MTWRTYSESMNPGQDFRTDSVADAAVIAPDNVYAPGTRRRQRGADRQRRACSLPLPAGLYKTKHHPGMAYQNVRSAPEFKYSNRTLGGGQWDARAHEQHGLRDSRRATTSTSSAPTSQPATSATLNFVIPDQCDDMHGITRARARSPPSTTTGHGQRLQQRRQQRAGRDGRQHPRARRQLRRQPGQEDPGLAALDRTRRRRSPSS